MKKLFIIAILVAVVANASAQQIDETPFGVIVNDNPNLRFVNAAVADSAKTTPKTKVWTVVSVQGGWFGGCGGAISVEKNTKNLGGGGIVGTGHSDNGWQSFAGLYMQAHTAFNNLQMLGLRLEGGYAQNHILTDMENGEEDTYRRAVSSLKPYGQISAIYKLRLTRSLSATALVGFRHSFIKTSDDKDQVLTGNWSLKRKKTDANQLVISLGLSKQMVYETQISGDNCWLAEGLYGQSNLGRFTGFRVINFKRSHGEYQSWGRVIGFGAEGFKNSGNTLSKIYGQVGARYLPMGASGHLAVESGVMVGMGEFPQNGVTASTKEDNGKTLSQISNYCQFGWDARLYGELSIFFDQYVVGAGVFVGPYSSNGNSYKSSYKDGNVTYDSYKGFSGDEGKTSGFEIGFYGKFAIAF